MSFSATECDIFLHHLAITSPAPEALAGFYGNVMDMIPSKSGEGEFRCEGPGRRLIISTGNAGELNYAGYSIRSADGLARFRSNAEEQGVTILKSPSPYFGTEAFCVQDHDGNMICFGLVQPEQDRAGLPGPIQHLTFASPDVDGFQNFYENKLGFSVTDRIVASDGTLATCFTTANHEHHTIACFKSDRSGIDHHSYEAGDWTYIRDWCDRFAAHSIRLIWGPGRHGPGNNLFIFIEDLDGNWIEVSAELEVIKGRPVKNWPKNDRTSNLWGVGATIRS